MDRAKRGLRHGLGWRRRGLGDESLRDERNESLTDERDESGLGRRRRQRGLEMRA